MSKKQTSEVTYAFNLLRNHRTYSKKNRFHITWHNLETNAIDSFEQDSEITLEESQRLWQWQRCQLSIGEKIFNFLEGDK